MMQTATDEDSPSYEIVVDDVQLLTMFANP